MMKHTFAAVFVLSALTFCHSAQARFLQSDPIGLKGGPSTYAAVSNSPLMRIDPLGLRDIFIGGAGDSSSQIVGSYYAQYHQSHPDSNYFTWDQQDQILALVNSLNKNEPINLIGHSYGGDTAARVAQKACRQVDMLITIDPVSRFHGHDYADIAAHAKLWVDVNGTGGSAFQISNFIAGLGGAWNSGPQGFATSYIGADNVHADFNGMMNAVGPGARSPIQVLTGQTNDQ
ncbi:MAG TPA: alpha/beta fold hydrolase [Rhodanobacter sp.]|nr:alpha/beta fold hydrolase [Rhodanobacter sp.]